MRDADTLQCKELRDKNLCCFFFAVLSPKTLHFRQSFSLSVFCLLLFRFFGCGWPRWPSCAFSRQFHHPEFDLENAHYGSLEAIRGVDFA
jgi:hypothetical protein